MSNDKSLEDAIGELFGESNENQLYMIVDIDGTIAELGNRLKCIEEEPKDYDQFFKRCGEDTPIAETIALVETLDKNLKIVTVFCTGRPESVRDITVEWLGNNVKISEYKLLMRPDDTLGEIHDTEVKTKLMDDNGINVNNTLFILEDRNVMVKHFRDKGYKVLQVRDGDF